MKKAFKDSGVFRVVTSPVFWGAVWFLVPVLAFALKTKMRFCNNYEIFINSFWHALDRLPLYIEYPNEYKDIFLYGISFTSIVAPFAMLPHILGVNLWNISGVVLLYAGLRGLKLMNWQTAVIGLVCLNEIYMTALGQQFNTAIAGLIVMSFVLLENRKPFWGALTIMIGTMAKIYGIVALAFLPFCRRRITLICSLIFWGLVLFVLPMLYSSPGYVISQYGAWFDTLMAKDMKNTYTLYTNVSFLGMVHRVTGWMDFSNLWLIIPGLLLFASPYLRVKQYGSKVFRMLFLASTLLFMVLFSTGTEESGYITALFAVGLWYVVTPTRKKYPWLNTGLLVYCFLFASMNQSDIFPRYLNENYIYPYSLKALPCMIIWLKIIFELLTCDFTEKLVPYRRKNNTGVHNIDIILPCYNPREGWTDVLINKNRELKSGLTDYSVRFILVNDGSSKGINEGDFQKLTDAIPGIVIVDNKENKGKGAAVRDGLMLSDSGLTLYTDYDFPYETFSMCDVVRQLESGYDIVVATRNKSYYGKLSLRRRLISYSTRILNFVVLGIQHTDTQGGLKGFNLRGKKILQETTIDRFLFDTEFIYRASEMQGISIKDIDAELRSDIHFANVGGNTVVTELGNLLKIAIKG